MHAKDRDVRKGAVPQALEILEDSERHTRAELPAALPAPPHAFGADLDALGEPMGIREVAQLIGCSAWTVRQQHVRAGLPCFRSSPNGKLIFYKNQTIRWLLKEQQKGGMNA